MFRYKLRTLLILLTIACVLFAVAHGAGGAASLAALAVLGPTILEWWLWCREKDQVSRQP